MFKKCFSTVACMNLGYKEIAAFAHQYDMQGIEIRIGNDGSILGFSTRDDLAELRTFFEKNKITITDLGSSACFRGYDEKMLNTGKLAVDNAQIVNVDAIRVFLGNFTARTDAVRLPIDYQGIIKALKELCDYAEESGVEIWIETHNEYSTGKVLKELLQDVGKENLKIIWDVIHPIEAEENLEETWAFIGDKIAHIHIKDGFNRKSAEWNDYQYTCLEEGAIPLYSLFDLLENVNYTGFVSLEWETAWRAELKKYTGDLPFALEQYNKLLFNYEKNVIGKFDSGWSIFDSCKQTETEDITVSAHGAMLELTVEEKNAALRKYYYHAEIQKNASYKITVPYDVDAETRELAHYGLISLYDENRKITRRLYLKRVMTDKLEISFTSEEECGLRLELGLKTVGKVNWYRPSMQEIVPIPERKVRIGAVHIRAARGFEYQDNLERISTIIDKAAELKPDILSFSETIGDRGTTLALEEKYECTDGAFCTLMREKARQYHCYMTFTFHELDELGHRHNTAVLMDRQGEIIGKYRKTHLSLGEYEEGLVPGDCYPVFDTDFGKVGLPICWDAYFPEPSRAMSFHGAEILFVSTAGNPTHRHIARAMENGVYVVVACPSMNESAGYKATKIINPRGEVLAHTNAEGDVAFAEIDLNKKDYIHWLSVGPYDTIPEQVYRNEARDDLVHLLME